MACVRSKVRSLLLLLGLFFSILACSYLSLSWRTEFRHFKSDLICHTSDPEDCYPRVFQPTDQFQVVHDDQVLRSGLHFRINISTGKKEAKLIAPGDDDSALLAVPVSVDEPIQPDDSQISKGRPEPASGPFLTAMNMLREGILPQNHTADEGLQNLEELSHDAYYGVRITEDTEAVKALFCLMVSQGAPTSEELTPRDQQAATILASALQNNPSALKEVAKVWPDIMGYKCPSANHTLYEVLYWSIVPSRNDDPAGAKQSASRVKAKVWALSGLLKDSSIRNAFLQNDGMDRLVEVLIPKEPEWAGAQQQAGELVMDNFLDEDMGAELGQWPKAPKLSDAQCQTKESTNTEGCWDYHIARIMQANKSDKSHWSTILNEGLATARGLRPPNEVTAVRIQHQP